MRYHAVALERPVLTHFVEFLAQPGIFVEIDFIASVVNDVMGGIEESAVS